MSYDIYKTGDINKSPARRIWEAGVRLSKAYVDVAKAERGKGVATKAQAWRVYWREEETLRMLHGKYGKNRPLPSQEDLLATLRLRYGSVGPQVEWHHIMDTLDPLLGV